MIYKFVLPFPPSVNGMFGQKSNKRRFKSKQYKEWLKKAPDIFAPDGMIDYPVKIEYTFFLPDRRKRDLSNYLKAPEDFLVSQCVIEDDNHTIAQNTVLLFGGIDRDNPRVEIRLYEVES